MKRLTRNDCAAALTLLGGLEAAANNSRQFAQEVVAVMSAFVASELTTLSDCDLASGQRRVVGLPGVRALAPHPPHWAALRRAGALAYHCRCP